MKRFALNNDKIEESEFGAFCLWAEAQKELDRKTKMLEEFREHLNFEQNARMHDLESAAYIEKRMKAALEEIIRNCEVFRRADTVADRLCKIAEEGLGR